jgi:hypothetical protein
VARLVLLDDSPLDRGDTSSISVSRMSAQKIVIGIAALLIMDASTKTCYRWNSIPKHLASVISSGGAG